MSKAQRHTFTLIYALLSTFYSISFAVNPASAQGLSAGTISGTVVDPNNAVVPNATLALSNPVTGYKRTAVTSADGSFQFTDVPPNTYQLTSSATGFETSSQTIVVRTSVPITLKISLVVGAATATVDITGIAADVLENVPTTHTDVDQSLIAASAG